MKQKSPDCQFSVSLYFVAIFNVHILLAKLWHCFVFYTGIICY